jgi:hypothetical protein
VHCIAQTFLSLSFKEFYMNMRSTCATLNVHTCLRCGLATTLFCIADSPWSGYNVKIDDIPTGSSIGLGGGTGGISTGDEQSAEPSATQGENSGSQSSAPESSSPPSEASELTQYSELSSASAGRKLRGMGRDQVIIRGVETVADGVPRAISDVGTESAKLHQRRLAQQGTYGSGPGWWQAVSDDELDGFRRGPQRDACAQRVAAGWIFAFPSGLVDESKYKGMVSGKQLVDIIKEASGFINN